MADFVDAFVIGDGEEVIGEITEVVGAWKRSGRTAREGVLRELATIPGVYVPVDVRGRLRRPVHPRGAPALRRRARAGRQAHRRRPRPVAVPEAPARPAHRGGARPAQRRGVPRLHTRLPLLPGGDDHPPGARASRGAGAHAWCATACAAPATTRSRSRRCPPPTSPASTAWSPGSSTSRRAAANVGLSLPSLRVDAFTVGHRQRDPEGAPHRAHVRPRGRHVADPPGDQQAHHRRRPLRRRRRCVLAGLAAGEALLPHRCAHRDGRRHDRHRRTSPARS